MKFLIINADDFGLAGEINRAIYSAHHHGVLTSTSLMAPGEAFEEAVELAAASPRLGVGIHATLVGGLRPVCDPADVPTLVDDEGNLWKSYEEFIRRDLARKIDYEDVWKELTAQFEKICASGLQITHVDGHQHLHVWTKVLPIVTALCHRYRIHCLRIPEERISYGKHLADWRRFLGKAGLSTLAGRARKYIRPQGLQTTDYFWGMMDGGRMTERNLLNILGQFKPGFHEIMCHPGMNDHVLGQKFPWGYHWTQEWQALESVRVYEKIMEEGIHRIHYGDIQP